MTFRTSFPHTLGVATLSLAAALMGCASDDSVIDSTGTEIGSAPAHSGGEHFERFAERLQLTEDQVALARPAFEDMSEQRQALRELPREQRREASQALRQALRSELEEVLTPEQLTQLDEMRASRGRDGRGRHGRGQHDPAAQLAHLTSELGLTEVQAEQVATVFETRQERMQSLRDSDATREERHALRDEFKAELEQILTPEQVEQMTALRAERSERGQHRRGARGHHGRRGPGAMLQGLDLTPEQETAARTVFEGLRDQRHAVRELPEEERAAAREALKAQVQEGLSAILTTEQLTQFETQAAEMPERGNRGPRQGRGQR